VIFQIFALAFFAAFLEEVAAGLYNALDELKKGRRIGDP
jgi:hypothetical protein